MLLLLDNGAYAHATDEHGATPLSYAAGNGHLAAVGLLLEKEFAGAYSTDRNGQTPLSSAARNGHEE